MQNIKLGKREFISVGTLTCNTGPKYLSPGNDTNALLGLLLEDQKKKQPILNEAEMAKLP